MQYKIKTFTVSDAVGRDMEVSLNVLDDQGWWLVQVVEMGGRLVAILQREDNE